MFIKKIVLLGYICGMAVLHTASITKAIVGALNGMKTVWTHVSHQ
jgi:hypothetical protein